MRNGADRRRQSAMVFHGATLPTTDGGIANRGFGLTREENEGSPGHADERSQCKSQAIRPLHVCHVPNKNRCSNRNGQTERLQPSHDLPERLSCRSSRPEERSSPESSSPPETVQHGVDKCQRRRISDRQDIGGYGHHERRRGQHEHSWGDGLRGTLL